jgi:hypothetical protein
MKNQNVNKSKKKILKIKDDSSSKTTTTKKIAKVTDKSKVTPDNKKIVEPKKKKKKKSNVPLTDKQKKKIIADYIETNNFHEVGRLNNVAPNTVKRIVKQMSSNGEDVAQLVTQKKVDNTNNVLEYIESLSELKKDLVNNILVAMNEKAKNPDFFTNFRDLSTGLGIIVDKEYKAAELALKREEIALKRQELELKKQEMEKNNNTPEVHNSFMEALKQSSTADLWNEEDEDDNNEKSVPAGEVVTDDKK